MAEQQHLSPEMLVPRMGEYLVHKGLVSTENLQKALDHQQEEMAKGNAILLGQALIDLKFIQRPQLDQAVTEPIIQLRSALQAANPARWKDASRNVPLNYRGRWNGSQSSAN